MEKKRLNEELERALEALDSNVLPFVIPPGRRARPPQFSDDELARLRAMLVEFDKIKQSCPMARRLLEGE